MAEQFKKFGRTWARYDGVKPCIVTIDPEFIKQVTVKQFDNFVDTFDLDLEDEQTTLDVAKGDTWRDLRKILSPTFTSGKMKGMLEPMEEMVERTIEYMSEQIKIHPNKLDVKPIINGFTMDVISKCAFGIETNAYKGENSNFTNIAKDVLEQFKATGWMGTIFFNIFSHFPILLKYIPIWPESAFKLRQMTHDVIEERIKKNIEIGDFIDKLKNIKSNLKPPLTPKMIDAQGMVFLIAGFETTANTLGHMVYLLAKNPEAQDRLYENITNIQAVIWFMLT